MTNTDTAALTPIEALERIAQYPSTRAEEMSAESMRALARAAIAAATAVAAQELADEQVLMLLEKHGGREYDATVYVEETIDRPAYYKTERRWTDTPLDFAHAVIAADRALLRHQPVGAGSAADALEAITEWGLRDVQPSTEAPVSAKADAETLEFECVHETKRCLNPDICMKSGGCIPF